MKLPDFAINPRDVAPQTAGCLFLIGNGRNVTDIKSILYSVAFVRVRVVDNMINVEDLEKVERVVKLLSEHKIPFITFSAGRGLPLPEYPRDLDELMDNAQKNAQLLKVQ